jgi:glucosyl-dolichyl phosphate glucuronosyltransferase
MLSVIICTYNRQPFLDQLFEGLVSQTLNKDQFEVVVVDNNSTDQTKAICEKWIADHPEIRMRYVLETRQGLSHARNRGIQESRGSLLSFVDDDAHTPPDFLRKLNDFFLEHPGIDGAGGRIVLKFEGSRPDWLNKYVDSLLGHFDLGDKTRLFRKKEYPRGSNMTFRSHVFEKAGGFDVELGRTGNVMLGGEEKEFYYRFRDHGFRAVYYPEAWLYHLVPDSRLSTEYLRKQAEGVGYSEALRVRQQGKLIAARLLFVEAAKWVATLLLMIRYTLSGQASKARFLFRFRQWVSRGLSDGLKKRNKAG